MEATPYAPDSDDYLSTLPWYCPTTLGLSEILPSKALGWRRTRGAAGRGNNHQPSCKTGGRNHTSTVRDASWHQQETHITWLLDKTVARAAGTNALHTGDS